MEIKERHYSRVRALVPRYEGDLAEPHLTDHLRLRFQAMTFLPPAVKPERPKLVPSADGAIRRLLLTIPAYAVNEPVMASAYQSLLKSLPASIELVVLVQKSAQQEVSKWLQQSNHDKKTTSGVFDDALNISIWAEDGYVVVNDTATKLTYFVEPYSFPRYGDGLVADFVTNYTDLKNTQAPLYFQGGNVLIGDTFFFIGADYPAKSLDYIRSGVLYVPPGQSGQDFIKSLYREYLDGEREIHYVGSTIPVPIQAARPITVNGEPWTETVYAGNGKGTVQPLFHIDMFVTLIGRQPSGKYLLLVGDPGMAADLLGETVPVHAMKQVFDNIAETLAAAGFEVIRNPLPLVYMDDTQAKERVWYFATANNALVQNAPTKEVWLPTYGYGNWESLQRTDAANRETWERLGFNVHMLSDFHPFAENLGAVHCIKKYLARG